MEQILQKILTELQNVNLQIGDLKTGQAILEKKVTGLEDRMTGLEDRMTGLEQRMDSLERGQEEIKSRLDKLELRTELIYNQTASLTEFRVETSKKLDVIQKDVEFLSHRGWQTEKELYTIKQSLLVAK